MDILQKVSPTKLLSLPHINRVHRTGLVTRSHQLALFSHSLCTCSLTPPFLGPNIFVNFIQYLHSSGPVRSTKYTSTGHLIITTITQTHRICVLLREVNKWSHSAAIMSSRMSHLVKIWYLKRFTWKGVEWVRLGLSLQTERTSCHCTQNVHMIDWNTAHVGQQYYNIQESVSSDS
jgi:hypothetical protein